MEKIFTISHTLNVPTDMSDFTSFVRMSDVEIRAVMFDLMLRVNKSEKKVSLLHEEVRALQSVSRPQEQGIEPSSSDSVDVAKTRVKIAKAEVPASTGEKSTGNEGSTLGKKIGKTSKYHFVNVQMRNDKFYTFKASTSVGGKSVNMGSHKDEIQCAVLADAYLDNIGDKKRPRNRDEFTEVLEAYKAGVQNENK